MGGRDHLECRDADSRDAERKGKTTGGSDADPDAGEGAGTDGHGDPLDCIELQASLVEHTIDQCDEMFGMALADGFGNFGEHAVAVAVIDGGGAIRACGIQRQYDHFRRFRKIPIRPPRLPALRARNGGGGSGRRASAWRWTKGSLRMSLSC